MPKKKVEQVLIKDSSESDLVEIHVTGDMLFNSTFLKILDHMEMYKDKQKIAFVVYDAKMMLLIRESIPSEYYEWIELAAPNMVVQMGALKNAG